jgi:hypothetical protein
VGEKLRPYGLVARIPLERVADTATKRKKIILLEEDFCSDLAWERGRDFSL